MTGKPKANPQEIGVVLVLVAALLVVFIMFLGIAIDLGMAYIVKGQMIKAVDGAALAAARALGSGSTTPERDEAVRIFRANFPAGTLGTSTVTDPTTDPNFFNKYYDDDTGTNVITVKAEATLPMTFLRVFGLNQINVGGMGEARRKTVDLSLAIDCSGSIGSDWGAVRDAARWFISVFKKENDRMAVTLYSDGAAVSYPIDDICGGADGDCFNQAQAQAAVPNNLPGGSTSMAEGLYRAWDQLRAVPAGRQASMRVIVLFTDGTPNGVTGNFQFNTNYYLRGLNTNDFPDPSNTPALFGLATTNCSKCSYNPGLSGGYWAPSGGWNSTQTSNQVRWLPANAQSTHPNQRSTGIPTSFPLQSNSLRVNGVIQSTARDLRNFNASSGRYPADLHNVNNAGRNLVEIIADAARGEYPTTGDYPIRIFCIGMGSTVNALRGTIPERSSDILRRIANDRTSTDHNSTQLAGKYYFAQGAADVQEAFRKLQAELVRLSK